MCLHLEVTNQWLSPSLAVLFSAPSQVWNHWAAGLHLSAASATWDGEPRKRQQCCKYLRYDKSWAVSGCPPFFFFNLYSTDVQHKEPQHWNSGRCTVQVPWRYMQCPCGEAGIEQVWEAECEVRWSYGVAMGEKQKGGVSRQDQSYSLWRSLVLIGKLYKFSREIIWVLKDHYIIMWDF